MNHPTYEHHLSCKNDIQEHLGFLRGLAMSKDVKRVVEFGFRTGVSTSAFLAAGAIVLSFDIDHIKCKPHIRNLAAQYPKTFQFKLCDSRKAQFLTCDLLFIDSDHTYATTLTELNNSHERVEKFIVLHDTVSFGRKDRPPGKGLGVYTAIQDFLHTKAANCWYETLHLPNCNGLTLLERDSR